MLVEINDDVSFAKDIKCHVCTKIFGFKGSKSPEYYMN